MTRNEHRHTAAAARLLLCAALLTGLPFFAACGGDNPEDQAANQTVQVRLTESRIEMPASLPTGKTTFQITNTGSHEHGFGITGPAGDKVLDETLKPGETAELEMELDTGTYRVYCPVDQGQGKPLQMALSVHPEDGRG